MTFKDNLIKARSYIVFIIGLLSAFVLVYYIEQHSVVPVNPRPPVAMIKTVIKPNVKIAAEAVSEREYATMETVSPVSNTDTPVNELVEPTSATLMPNVTVEKAVLPVVTDRGVQNMMADNAMQPKSPGSLSLTTSAPGKTRKRSLNEQEQQWARTAWKYFANNTQSATGMVNSVNGYPAATIWDTASYMLAAISAERLQVIERQDFDQRMNKLLISLAKLPLFDNKLPNKSYNTQTLAMVSYTNKESEKGIGWSAIDIARMLVPLHIIKQRYPQHAQQVKQVLARWKMTELVHDDLLFGAAINDKGAIRYLQEGRLGYEQYAAKACALFGLNAKTALSYTSFLDYADIYSIKVGIDSRDSKQSGANNYMLSEPYVLDGLEFGFDAHSRELAARLFKAQEVRFMRTGKLTAVTEDHIDSAPYFVYNTVYVNGQQWAAITDKGQDASAFRSLSTKAVFGWQALYDTPYTNKMLTAVSTLNVPEQGWYAGLYEQSAKPNKSLNANTNAVVLESLAYIKFGKLL